LEPDFDPCDAPSAFEANKNTGTQQSKTANELLRHLLPSAIAILFSRRGRRDGRFEGREYRTPSRDSKRRLGAFGVMGLPALFSTLVSNRGKKAL